MISADSASVLQKAFKDILQPVCPNARWVPCASHILNNVAKGILESVQNKLTKLFERGPGMFHAKRYAARRRRWFAFLRAEQAFA